MAERPVYLRGEIDLATAPTLQGFLDDVIGGCETDLVVDCCDLTFIDSQGIAVLITTQNTLHAEGRSLRIVNASPVTRRVINLMGLDELLRVDEPARFDHAPPN